MSAALLLSLAGLCVVAALHAVHVAAQARADVGRVAELLVQAEDLWADRHRLSVADGDDASQLASMRTQGDILRARADLEARYGL